MENDPDVLQVAGALLRTFGPRAVLMLQDKADFHLGIGDDEAGDFWWRVTLAIREMETEGLAVVH